MISDCRLYFPDKMESISQEGLIVLRDPGCCGSELIVQSLALKASSYLVVTACHATTSRRLPLLTNGDSFIVVSATTSPSSLVKSVLSKSPSIVIIDWFGVLQLEWGLDTVIRTIGEIKVNSCVCLIVNAGDVDDTGFRRVIAEADSVFKLERRGAETFSAATIYKKNGKIVELKERYTISTGDVPRVSAVKVEDVIEESNETTAAPMPSLTTSFDIGLTLKDSEKTARDNLQLPYTKMQNEQGLVGIRMTGDKKVRVGGQIIYTPDDGDDLDDSDPDDDLNL